MRKKNNIAQKKEETVSNEFQKPPTGLKGISKYIASFKLHIAALILLGTISNSAALLIPKMIGDGIDAYGQGTFDSTRTGIILVGVTMTVLGTSIAQKILSTITTEQLAHHLRRSLAVALSKQSFTFIQDTSASRLLTNFTSDIDEVKQIISQGVVTIVSAIVMIIGSAVLLFTINWRLALAALATFPIMVLLFQFVMSNIRTLFRDARQNTDELNKVITESIIGAMLVRVLSAQQEFHARFDVANSEAKRIGYKLLSVFGSFLPLLNIMSSASIIIVVWYGGFQVIDGQLTVGEFTAFYAYLAGLLTPVFILGFVSNLFVRAGVAFGRIQKVLEHQVSESGTKQIEDITHTIEFDTVSLSIEEQSILKDISFEIPVGKYTAIIGPTAAGKTHLLYLLLGLLEAQSGAITVDGVPLSYIDSDTYLQHFGIVFQDHVIFTSSIRENITLGREYSDNQIWSALEVANLKTFVERLPEQLDTQVSERGSNLSGGQKQRLALARAVISHPVIILLDDFTARVDRATDKRIRERVVQLSDKQTIVSISQTIESITDADQIILLMEGEVVATGTHEELLSNSFEYKQILESQQSIEV